MGRTWVFKTGQGKWMEVYDHPRIHPGDTEVEEAKRVGVVPLCHVGKTITGDTGCIAEQGKNKNMWVWVGEVVGEVAEEEKGGLVMQGRVEEQGKSAVEGKVKGLMEKGEGGIATLHNPPMRMM